MDYISCNGRRNYGPFDTREQANVWGASWNGKEPGDSRVTSCNYYTWQSERHNNKWFVEFGA